jgi:hypothetical protein
MFYEFDQNNTGGTWVADEDLGYKVFIEADGESAAIDKAESIGIYFDGCRTGNDCPCCGDRWHEPWGVGEDSPTYYGKPLPLTEAENPFGFWKLPIVVHRADGTRKYYDEDGGSFDTFEEYVATNGKPGR